MRGFEKICLAIIATVLVGVALHWLRPVMIPFVLSLFIALSLASFVDLVRQRLRVGSTVAIVAALFCAVLAFSVVGVVISASVNQIVVNMDVYQQQVVHLGERVFGVMSAELRGRLSENGAHPFSQIPISAVGNVLLATTNAVSSLLSSSFLVAIFVLFLMLGRRQVREASGVWKEIEERIKHYIIIKTIVSGATGILVGTVLAFLDVPLALAFGLLAFLLNFIPNIGSFVSTILPIPVVVIAPEVSFQGAILAIAIPGVIQFVVGSIVEPKLMGESLDLHPVAILVALILWGTLWGVVGMLLATPITVTMKILFERFPATKLLANLLAGRVEDFRSPSGP